MKRMKNETRRGAALALVMAVIVLMTIAGMSLLAMSEHARMHAVSETQVMQSKSAADAGLERAMYLVQQHASDTTWPGIDPVTDTPLPGTPALYSYTVTGAPSIGLSIAATGKCGPMQRSVSCAMGDQVDLYGMVADGEISFKNSLDVDGEGAALRTNLSTEGAIEISNGTVDADVIAGPGADIEEAIHVKDGDIVAPHGKSAASTKVALPAVTVPAALDSATLLPSNTTVIPASALATSYKANGLNQGFTVKAPNNVTLYIKGNLDVGNQGDVVVEKGASLTIYADGNITGKNGVGIQGSDNSDVVAVAESIKILGTENCKTINVKNNGSSYGLIYAPSADFEYKNKAKMNGALMVKSITAKNSASFHYIRELQNNASGIPATTVAMTRWWE